MERTTISAEEFDRLFDDGGDGIDAYVDWTRTVRPIVEQDIDFELDLDNALTSRMDAFAQKIGTTRVELVRRWLTEKLDEAA